LSFVTQEDIRAARSVDVLSYLQKHDPGELVPLGNGNYCTRTHDSLKISNGMWHWFSRNTGGKSAVDYLTKVQGCSFVEAVQRVLGDASIRASPTQYLPTRKEPRKLLLPERNDNADAVTAYLENRGISREIIDFCLSENLLYESKDYHNAVFLGYDSVGKARYAALRGTYGDYKGEASGSDKHYSFRFDRNPNASVVHLFESAIDLLSFATLLLQRGEDWRSRSLLSLAGVFQTKRENVVPIALTQFLQEHPGIRVLYLHLDNDEVGRAAAAGIIGGLREQYKILNAPAPRGKDINEYLQMQIQEKKKEDFCR